MKELADAATAFRAGPEENPEAFSAGLDTLNLYGKYLGRRDKYYGSIRPKCALLPTAQSRTLASMDEKDRAAEFHRLFREFSGHEDALDDTTENRVRGIHAYLQYFVEMETASVLTEQDRSRLDELDRKFLGFAEGRSTSRSVISAR